MSGAALFRGLSAFPLTPADAAGRVDTDALARLLERLVAAGVDSIGLLGSTGIYPYLSRAERRRAVAAAAECVRGRVPLIVGIGALRTDDAQDLARDAAQAGADAVLLAPVSYIPLTEEEVFRHFVAVAGVTDRPLCIYNNPVTTGFTFSDALIGRLAGVANVAAIKNPSPPAEEATARYAALRARVPEDFVLGYSGDWRVAPALLAGGQTWYSVIGGLLPGPALALMRAAQAGDAVEVARLDARFAPMWALFREFGGLRVVYAAAAVLGLCTASPPLPILPPGREHHDRILAALDALEVRVPAA